MTSKRSDPIFCLPVKIFHVLDVRWCTVTSIAGKKSMQSSMMAIDGRSRPNNFQNIPISDIVSEVFIAALMAIVKYTDTLMLLVSKIRND